MTLIHAHPWLSLAFAWFGLGVWIAAWCYAATPRYPRTPDALRTGSRWGKHDARSCRGRRG